MILYIYIFVTVASLFAVGCFALMLAVLFAQPPTLYEDLPPKNWDEIEDDPIMDEIRANERRWNSEEEPLSGNPGTR